jgi:hypothetical protein
MFRPDNAERNCNVDVTGQAIADLAPDVPIKFLPSPYQHARWGKWVSYDDGADVDGNFLGRCPLGEDEHGAVFNFVKDVMRCDGYPPCV